jgi:hypothetical protein
VQAVFNRVEANANALQGVGVFGNRLQQVSTTSLEAVAIDCVAAHNGANGFYALGNASTTGIITTTAFDVFRSAAFNNSTAGVRAEAGAVFKVGQSYLADNHALQQQVPWSTDNIGQIASYGDNYTTGVLPPGNSIPKR